MKKDTNRIYQRSVKGGQFWIIVFLVKGSILEYQNYGELILLLGKGGLYGNVLRIKSPMLIHKEDVDFLIEVLDITQSDL